MPFGHESGILGGDALGRAVEADVDYRGPIIFTRGHKAGDEMIPGDARINFPHQVVACNQTADGRSTSTMPVVGL